jgi:general L-amino acid transport system substrate-binding protein
MYFDGDALHGAHTMPDDIIFMSSAQAVGTGAAAAATLQLGPAIDHDSLALLVPAAGVKHAAELAHKRVCVEPGSASDRALTRYFTQHAIALREHPFQETDEMRQAFGSGNCDALAGPLSTLASVRADPQDGQRADRILPELLADDPIFAATAGDARWSRIIWWTFSALVNAEDSGIDAATTAADLAIPGVPPVVGTELGLSTHWASDVIAAGGNYGRLFDRDLGRESRLHLDRGINALWRNGGLVTGLHVE